MAPQSTPEPRLRPAVVAAEAKLIVTLALDPASQAFFDATRTQHFPPARLHVGAHVTLFHALPGSTETAVAAALARAAAATSAMTLRVTGLRSLGRGVAYALAGAEMVALRARLRRSFAEWLTPQDRAVWTPHVTVQNKVAPAVARTTLASLQQQAWPGEVAAIGLALWRYRGGPWEDVAVFAFARSNLVHGGAKDLLDRFG